MVQSLQETQAAPLTTSTCPLSDSIRVVAVAVVHGTVWHADKLRVNDFENPNNLPGSLTSIRQHNVHVANMRLISCAETKRNLLDVCKTSCPGYVPFSPSPGLQAPCFRSEP